MSGATHTSSAPSPTGAKPLRVGLIGYGLAGQVFHAPLIASTPGMEVAAISTGSPERQMRALRDYPAASLYTTAEELLRSTPQLDLIVVASPNRAHVPLGVAALEEGIPVVIDKPLAASSADGELMLATSKKAGKLFTVFQSRRWDNDFLTLSQLIAADALGPIVRFESRFERFQIGRAHV